MRTNKPAGAPNKPNKPRSFEAKFMAAALHKGAGTLTKQKMRTTFRAFAAHAKERRYGPVDPSTITEKQLGNYVASRIKAGITARTIQNEMSHLRRALRGTGRAELADAVTNAKLGVPKGTRIGKGRVVDERLLAQVLANAQVSPLVRRLPTLCRHSHFASDIVGSQYKQICICGAAPSVEQPQLSKVGRSSTDLLSV